MNNKYTFEIFGTDKTKKMFLSLRSGLRGVRSAVNSTQVRFAALAGVAGIAAVVKSNSAAIDSMAKMSDRLNISTQDLAAYHHMTQLNGETASSFDKSLEKMTRSLGEANRGIGTGKTALEQMGIPIESLIGMDAGKQFEIIAEGISKQADQATKASLASDIFGRSGVKLLNTINQGAEGIASAREEVDSYGLALTRVDAAKVEDANDQLLRVGKVATGLGQKLTVTLAPFISVVAEKFVSVSTEGDRMGKVVTKAIGFAVKGVGVFADGIRGLKVIFLAVKTVVIGFAAAVGVVFTELAAGIVAGFTQLKRDFTVIFREIFEVIAPFSDTAAGVLASLNDQLSTPPQTPAFITTMREANASLISDLEGTRGELQDLMMEEIPSSVIQQKWEQIQAEAEVKAQETASKIAAQLNTTPAGDTGALGETEAEANARMAKEQAEQDRIAARLQRLDESYFTELEMLSAKHAQELELITQAEEAKTLTEQAAKDRRLRADQAFEEAKTGLTQKAEGARRAMITGALGQIESLMSGGSKKMFKVKKAAAMAQALVSLPAAVIDSFKNGGGYPWGLIPAGLMLATGMKQIASIKSQTYGGSGGGAPSVSAGGGSVSIPSNVPNLAASSIGNQFDKPAEKQAPQTIVNLTISGDVVGDTAGSILTKMRSLIEDNDAVLFSSNSRQALELAGT